jgi:hypothetical protein
MRLALRGLPSDMSHLPSISSPSSHPAETVHRADIHDGGADEFAAEDLSAIPEYFTDLTRPISPSYETLVEVQQWPTIPTVREFEVLSF